VSRPGFHIKIIGPDSHKLTGDQRDALLSLAEAGLITSPIRVRKLGGRFLAVDRAGNSYTIRYDGLSHPTPPQIGDTRWTPHRQ
jgi:hypothetical protein